MYITSYKICAYINVIYDVIYVYNRIYIKKHKQVLNDFNGIIWYLLWYEYNAHSQRCQVPCGLRQILLAEIVRDILDGHWSMVMAAKKQWCYGLPHKTGYIDAITMVIYICIIYHYNIIIYLLRSRTAVPRRDSKNSWIYCMGEMSISDLMEQF